jgi:iron complex transport system substrate-binding protein
MRRGVLLVARVWLALSMLAGSVLAAGNSAGGSPSPGSQLAAGGQGRVLTDDWDRQVRLPPGRLRIASLAPHATELLAAAGAVSQLVAIDPHSDTPPVVRGLPRIAAYPVPDIEALAAWRPDLVVIWGAGARRDAIARLESLGMPVFVSDPRGAADISRTLRQFASVSEQPAAARQAAREFDAVVAGLGERYRAAAVIPVFIQLAARPLMTLTDRDPIADALRLCGARNVFGSAPGVAAGVSAEAVLASAPALILAFDRRDARQPWLDLGVLAPQGRLQIATIDPAIQRPGPRWSTLLSQVCDAVQLARAGAPHQQGAAR